MANYNMRGDELYDKINPNKKVAYVRGDDIYDFKNGFKVAYVRGTDIYDKNGHKIESLDNVRRQIDGAMGGVTVAALWLFFIR